MRTIILRRSIQLLSLLASIAVFFFGNRSLTWLMAFDPLAALTASLASRSFLWSWGWLLAFSTLLFGRFFCGWLCPLGTLNHLIGKMAFKKGPSGKLRLLKYGLLLLLLATAGTGLNTAGFFDPLSIFFSGMQLIFLPKNWGNALLSLPLLGLLALNLLHPRFWCRYLCPLGAMLGGLSWFGPDVQSNCLKCGRCYPTCSMGSNPGRFDNECIRCGNCREVCPQKARKLLPEAAVAFARTRRALLAGTLFSIPFLCLKGFFPKRGKPALLRPPGVTDENEFLARCQHCGLCLRACPSQALQPCLFEAGLESFKTPKLVPRLGSCQPNCNSCGQNCPTGAVPALDLARKNKARIGLARVDSSLCVSCLRCVEACPHGALSAGPYPRVNPALCIGCGRCENVCPLDDAAIAVFP